MRGAPPPAQTVLGRPAGAPCATNWVGGHNQRLVTPPHSLLEQHQLSSIHPCAGPKPAATSSRPEFATLCLSRVHPDPLGQSIRPACLGTGRCHPLPPCVQHTSRTVFPHSLLNLPPPWLHLLSIQCSSAGPAAVPSLLCALCVRPGPDPVLWHERRLHLAEAVLHAGV